VFGIAIAVMIAVLKKLFYKKYFYLRLVWKNICLVKIVVEIEVEQKVVQCVWLKMLLKLKL
jgi:hypothetical protein